MKPQSKILLLTILTIVVSCSSDPQFTQDEKKMARLFIKAQQADFQSIDISNKRGPGLISQEEIDEMLMWKRKALSLAQEIPDDVLEKMHKDLPSKYKVYKQALSLRIENLENGDYQAELEGTRLMDEYIEWYDANRHNIKIPK